MTFLRMIEPIYKKISTTAGEENKGSSSSIVLNMDRNCECWEEFLVCLKGISDFNPTRNQALKCERKRREVLDWIHVGQKARGGTPCIQMIGMIIVFFRGCNRRFGNF